MKTLDLRAAEWTLQDAESGVWDNPVPPVKEEHECV